MKRKNFDYTFKNSILQETKANETLDKTLVESKCG